MARFSELRHYILGIIVFRADEGNRATAVDGGPNPRKSGDFIICRLVLAMEAGAVGLVRQVPRDLTSGGQAVDNRDVVHGLSTRAWLPR